MRELWSILFVFGKLNKASKVKLSNWVVRMDIQTVYAQWTCMITLIWQTMFSSINFLTGISSHVVAQNARLHFCSSSPILLFRFLVKCFPSLHSVDIFFFIYLTSMTQTLERYQRSSYTPHDNPIKQETEVTLYICYYI